MTVFGIDPSFTSCGLSDGVRHSIIATAPRDGEQQIDGLIRRSREIADGVLRFIGEMRPWDPNFRAFIEAPMLRSAVNGGNHLFDMGWLMSEIFRSFDDEYGFAPVLVPTLAVKKFASGKGNTKKDEMKLAAFKKWGVEFEKDPGCDKLHAFVLHKYGEAMLRGEIDAPVIKRRGKGQGKDKKAA